MIVAEVVAILTGERGQREITRPLEAVGMSCVTLDWEQFSAQAGNAYLRFIPAVWKLVRDHPGAAVFTDMSSVFLAVILLAAKTHGERVLLRLRGDPLAETRDQLRFHWQQREWPQLLRSIVSWLLDRPLFGLVDHFVPVSEWIVRRLGIADRATVVRIPVPIENFPPRQHASADPLRLLAVTNFNYPQKVAAMGRFLADYGEYLAAHRIVCTVAGTGIAWETFRQRYSRSAEFPGFVRDVAGLYASHDVFVHFSDLDAFPYVVLEAQAAGLPVIVNRDCGMLEQVEDGVNGYIVDLTDRSAVEARLQALQESSAARAALGTRAREMVAHIYSLPAIGAALRAALARR